MPVELVIDHNAGFFSCCSVRLAKIIHFFNDHKKEPLTIDWSKQFAFYKKEPNNPQEDLNLLFFSLPDSNSITYQNNIHFHWDSQFEPYSNLDYTALTPFIKKYFNPSNFVKELLLTFENKTSINYENTVGVCYRGNDKHQETDIAPYEQFIKKCQDILKESPNINFFVQTDETEFKDIFIKEFPNTFFYHEIPTINANKGLAVHDLISLEQKSFFAALFLSSIIALSKCKNIVTHSGNCGMWTTLYRGNNKNVYQFLNHKTNKLGWI
jgi:hypothetical protein